MIRDHPLFVEHGSEHLAAVLTLPANDPKGVVLLLTGIGLPQTIGSTLYARVAAGLAQRNLAAVRFDYTGIGDSTGVVDRYFLSKTDDVTAQARSVLSAASSIVGVDQFALAGNCIGSRVTLELARSADCVSAVCVAAPILEPGHLTVLDRRAASLRPIGFIRRRRWLRRAVIRPIKRVLRGNPARRVLLSSLTEALEHAKILFLYSESPRDHYNDHVRQLLVEAAASAAGPGPRNFAFTLLSVGPLTAFDSLSAKAQESVVAEIVDWLSTSFETPQPDSPPATILAGAPTRTS